MNELKRLWSYMCIDEENVRIGGYSGTEIDVTIPDVIEDTLVTLIYSGAFSPKSRVKPEIKASRKEIKAIKMSDWIEQIDTSAFEGCESLEEIHLSNNLKKLGTKAFKGCIGLRTIQLPDSLRSIAEETFMNCIMLERIIIPESVTEINKKAFYNCQKLKEVYLPKTITYISADAFVGVDPNAFITSANSYAEEYVNCVLRNR